MHNHPTRRTDAIAYRRVSTAKQGASGVGLEAQNAAIESYALHDRFRVTDMFVDVASGRGPKNLINRPGLQAAIKLSKATERPIIVASFDRLSREEATIDEIINEHGITIYSAADGKMRDRAIVASEAARAQRHGELISETTRMGLARAKSQGVLLGNRTNPEYAREKAAEKKRELADAKVQEIVEVLDELGDKYLTARELVDILNQREIRTSRGLTWTLPAIRRPLANARMHIARRNTLAVSEHYKNNPLFGRF